MATSVQNITPSVLEWARKRKNYSPADIAKKLHSSSITMEVVGEWESGENAPTYPQLEKLAHFYKVPIAVFFFPEPPEIKDELISFRSIRGFDWNSISPHVMDIIHRVQATQMALMEFNDHVNPNRSPIHKRIKLNPSERVNVESLAKKLRSKDFLNITVDKQLGWSDSNQALSAWRSAIEESGIFVFRWPFKTDLLSGFCLYDEEFPVICLNSEDIKVRQIFTLLHELAHLLHGKSSATVKENGLKIWGNNIEEDERYFDRIAGSTLVPMDNLEAQAAKGAINTDDWYVQTAKRYKVSNSMLLVRCASANLIPRDTYSKIWNSLEKRWQRIKSRQLNKGGGGDYYRTQLSYWGRGFLYNILSRHYENRIDEHEISQILGMKRHNIEKLEGYLRNDAAVR